MPFLSPRPSTDVSTSVPKQVSLISARKDVVDNSLDPESHLKVACPTHVLAVHRGSKSVRVNLRVAPASRAVNAFLK